MIENNADNKALTYSIGLITYDELMYAGINYRKANKYSYVSSNILYWTMNPLQFYKDNGLEIGTLNYGERSTKICRRIHGRNRCQKRR